MKKITFHSNAVCITLALFFTSTFSFPVELDASEEIEELRAMVLALKKEVEALKEQLASKEEKRDVVVDKPEEEAPTRAPLKMPAVAGVSSKFGLSIYGYFKLDSFYNTAQTSHQEIPFWVASDEDVSSGEFDMTAKETRLGINMAGPDVSGGNVSGKLEFDFFGKINTPGSVSGNHAFQLRTRHAYLNWDFGEWSILAGKTWEPYLITFPQTLNFGYNNFAGQLGLRKTQLRFTRKVGSDLEWVGAILEPVGGVHGADVDGDGQDDGTDSDFPVLSGKVVYKLPVTADKSATLGASFVYGKERFDIPVAGNSDTYDAWAVTGAVSVPLGDRMVWSTSAFLGANMDSYWGGIAQGVNHALGEEISGYGGWTELKLKATDKYTLNLGYSVDNPDNEDLWTGARSKNEILRINSFYEFSPSLILGLEFLDQKTSYKSRDAAKNKHFHTALIFKF